MSAKPHTQRGASLLEFLVTLPVLVTLIFISIEFGSIFIRLNTITKSVQDATRYLSDVKASADATNTAAQKDIAINLVKYGSVGVGQQLLPGTYQEPTISNPDVNHVRVSVTYNHTPVAGQALNNLLQLLGGSGVDLTMQLPASSTMRFVQ